MRPSLASACLVLALLLPGCAGATLPVHSAASAVALLAVDGADAALETHLAEEVALCADDACGQAARDRAKPIRAALDVAHVAVQSWRDAVAVARRGIETGDLLEALRTAVQRVLERWGELAAALRPIGIDLPTLPPSVTALVRGTL